MMKSWPWKSLVKWAVALAILAFVGLQFHKDLARLDLSLLHFRWEWVVVSAALYLASQAFWGAFWRHVLVRLGKRPGWLEPMRAYFVGQLGKYVPGKAWALLVRGHLIGRAGVPMGLSIFTSFYEVLTTM